MMADETLDNFANDESTVAAALTGAEAPLQELRNRAAPTAANILFSPQAVAVGNELPTVTNEAQYNALPYNNKYRDPDGVVRTKYRTVGDQVSYDQVPEGSPYLSSDGVVRTKPKPEGIDYTAQTLYDMAVNDKERKNALERSYPGKVKRDPRTKEFYVDDDGTIRKPGYGLNAVTGFVSAAALPVGLSMAGAVGLGRGGPMGAVVGGATGAFLGQGFNDAIMALSGVIDRDINDEASAMTMAGVGGAAGAGVGRGLATIFPTLAKFGEKAGQLAPYAAAKFLGTDVEKVRQARSLAERGAHPLPSTYAPEAPMLQLWAEVLDPRFSMQNVAKTKNLAFYENEAGQFLEQFGVPRHTPLPDPMGIEPAALKLQDEYFKSVGNNTARAISAIEKEIADDPAKFAGATAQDNPLVRALENLKRQEAGSSSIADPTYAVSSRPAGELVLQRAAEEVRLADERVNAALEKARATGFGRAALDDLEEARREAQVQADRAVRSALDDVQTDINAAYKTAEVDGNSGVLWDRVGNKIQNVFAAVRQRASQRYNEWDLGRPDQGLPGYGHLVPPGQERMRQTAEDLFMALPEQFKANNAPLTKQLAKLAGDVEKDIPPTDLSLGELHRLRSLFRAKADYNSLPSSIVNGELKFLEREVNGMLHSNASPVFERAAKELDNIDAYYRKNIQATNDKKLQSIVSALESGLPPDPQVLKDVILREGNSSFVNKVRKLVGPPLWNAIRAADKEDMLRESQSLIPGRIDLRRFADQVESRLRTGGLDLVHSAEDVSRLRQIAQYADALEGRLDVALLPGDTFKTILGRVRALDEAIKAEAKSNPLGTLEKEVRAATAPAKEGDPLKFLYDPSLGAVEAANRILHSEDLILAVARKWGADSKEFDALRQVWVRKLFQGSTDPGAKLAKVSPEVQQLMLPGVSLSQAHAIAKDMRFLMSARDSEPGASIMATSRVTHPPIGTLGRWGITAAAATPVSRFLLGKFYGLMREGTANPAFLRALEKALVGGEEARKAAKAEVHRHLQRGTAIGASLGETLEQDRRSRWR